MVLNQDGSVQLMLGETEIGQGADTAFSQMAADAIGVKFEDIHIITNQDTDITPFGTAKICFKTNIYSKVFLLQKQQEFSEKNL